MGKIGIMGGTFDPIHRGHILLGVEAQRQFALDQVLFMPTGIPAYKMNGQDVTDGECRAAMVALAIQGYDQFALSDIELRRAGNTYTADTLSALCEQCPDQEYYYIVGADSLDYMDRWYHPEIIFQKAVILAAKRNTQTEESFLQTMDFLRDKYHADIRLLEVPEVPVSSSAIRTAVSQHMDVSSWVDEKVLLYIREHHLYEK